MAWQYVGRSHRGAGVQRPPPVADADDAEPTCTVCVVSSYRACSPADATCHSLRVGQGAAKLCRRRQRSPRIPARCSAQQQRRGEG
eukprot:347537-Alexandrium_andersonii.AAC.1